MRPSNSPRSSVDARAFVASIRKLSLRARSSICRSSSGTSGGVLEVSCGRVDGFASVTITPLASFFDFDCCNKYIYSTNMICSLFGSLFADFWLELALSSCKNQFVLSSFFDTFVDSKRLNIVRSVYFNIFLCLPAFCRPWRAVLQCPFRHESVSPPRRRRGQELVDLGVSLPVNHP